MADGFVFSRGYGCRGIGSGGFSGVIMKYAVYITLFVTCLAGAYLLGRAHCEVKIQKERVEVIKYVSKKNEKIYTRPNDNFIAIYKRMREQR